MKKILTNLLLAVAGTSFAQGLNTELAFNDQYLQTTTATVVSGEYTFQAINENLYFPKLCKLDTAGNILWTVDSWNLNGAVFFSQLRSDGNGGVFISGTNRAGCDAMIDCKVFIMRVDGNGDIVWVHTWNTSDCSEQSVSGLSVTQNEDILFHIQDSGNSWTYALDFNGQTTDSVETAFPGSMYELWNGLVYEASNDFINSFSPLGTIVNSMNFTSTVSGMSFFQDTLFVTTQDMVYKLDADLQIIASESYALQTIKQLHVDASQISLIGTTASGFELYSMDHNFANVQVESFLLDNPNTYLMDFDADHVSLSQNFYLTNYFGIRYLDYSRHAVENAVVNRSDIAVLDFAPTSVNIFPVAQYVYTSQVEGLVLVKNVGSNVVTSVRLNHYLMPNVACGDNVYTQEFTGLLIEPGDSMWIDAGIIDARTMQYQSDVLTIDMCIYSSYVNKLSDLNVSNDSWCESIYLGTVGLGELVQTEKSLIRVTDILGRPAVESSGQVLFYHYSDGSISKRYSIAE